MSSTTSLLRCGHGGAFEGYRTDEIGLTVVLQKIYDTPFVSPLDVPTGATTDDSILRERY